MPRELENQLGGGRTAARPDLQMAAVAPAPGAPRSATEPVDPHKTEAAPPAGRRIVAPLSLRARTR